MKTGMIPANLMRYLLGDDRQPGYRGRSTTNRGFRRTREKTVEERIIEGRKAPNPKPVPKFKHREQKKRRRR